MQLAAQAADLHVDRPAGDVAVACARLLETQLEAIYSAIGKLTSDSILKYL